MVRPRGLLASCLLAPVVLASPHLITADVVPVPKVEVVRDVRDAGVRRNSHLVSREPGAPMVRRNGLAARTDTRSFSLEQTLENEPIFNSSSIPLFPGPSIEVVCVKCCSSGSIDATFPSDLDDIINPKFRVDLTGVEVFVELDVVVSAGNTFTIPLLLLPPGLTNIELPGFRAGLFIDLGLVFELSGQVDLRGGFYLQIPEGSFFEIDISADGTHSEEFTGVISKPLPITVNGDDTELELKIDLQLTAELGIAAGTNQDLSIPGLGGVDIPFVDLPNIGAGAMVGAFINIVEYIATLAPSAECALDATQELNLNLGVFAEVGVTFQDEFIGVDPSATTTLFTLPLPSACLLDLGAPIPVREEPLAMAGECAAAPAPTLSMGVESVATSAAVLPTAVDSAVTMPEVLPTAVSHVGEDEEITYITATSTLIHTIVAPYPEDAHAGYMFMKRQEASVEDFTAVACLSALAACPEDLKTTVTYQSTVCPPVAAATGNCVAVTDASSLVPTSVVTTKTPPVGTDAAGGMGQSDTVAGRDTDEPCTTDPLEEEDSNLTAGSSDAVLPSSVRTSAAVSVPLGTGSALPTVDFTVGGVPGTGAPPAPSASPPGELVQVGGGSRVLGGALASVVAVAATWLLI